MGRKSFCGFSSILAALVKLIISATILSAFASARPIYVRQNMKDDEITKRSFAMNIRDEEDGHFYGIPGFFLYPLPSSFSRGSSTVSASIGSLQVLILSSTVFLMK